MIRTVISAVVIALFVLQNLVFCCAHVHTSAGESRHCRPHVHLHTHHGHGHDHSHHHPHDDGHDHDRKGNHDDPHDCVITSSKQDAIIQDSTRLLPDFHICGMLEIGALYDTSPGVDNCRIRLSKHLYWLLSNDIHLQLRALLN